MNQWGRDKQHTHTNEWTWHNMIISVWNFSVFVFIIFHFPFQFHFVLLHPPFFPFAFALQKQQRKQNEKKCTTCRKLKEMENYWTFACNFIKTNALINRKMDFVYFSFSTYVAAWWPRCWVKYTVEWSENFHFGTLKPKSRVEMTLVLSPITTHRTQKKCNIDK